MTRLNGLGRLLTLAALGLSLTGCVVLPFGGRGHYERGDHRHWSGNGPSQGVPQAPPGRGR